MRESDRGILQIGLYKFQENEWIKAIQEYGENILEKSLLTKYQKSKLIEYVKNQEILRGEQQQAKLSFYND